jgi:DNA-nicking Smr family endonuclease
MSATRSIDLHNFTVAEALREFVRFYNASVRGGYRGRVEVIHGYGSNGTGGVIREELRRFLAAHEEIFGEFLAGESLRNPGVTIVYVKDALAPVALGQGSMDASGSRSWFRGPAPPRKGKNRF